MAGGRVDAWSVRGNRLVRWGERRIERHSSGRLGSLILGCLLRFAESSENSASALVLGTFLSVVPALLAVYALTDLSAGSGNGIAQHLIYRLHIHPPAVALVASVFGSEASNAAAASVAGLLGFLIFGLGLGKIVQDVYARAWRISVSSPTDRWRFAVWFVVSTTLLGLQVSEESVVSFLGWVVLSPIGLAVLVAFWLWTPWFLLHRQVELRMLLPGALLVAVTYMGAVTVSEVLLGYWITDNGRFFGSFGVALALLSWGQVLAGIWLVCGVFSAVYAEWRDGWNRCKASPFTHVRGHHERASGQTEN
ncbi:MAG TPA: YhjD/YihY/BrkB family envelope integrity protein [Streptosporangiaceae bacterium]|nr:YhjD/YihY/BrkB family envelope integrity protein [Streptosporangiaceae bacterium]